MLGTKKRCREIALPPNKLDEALPVALEAAWFVTPLLLHFWYLFQKSLGATLPYH